MSKKVIKEEVRYINFPWSSVSGFFNGDMFEDWLKEDSNDDPHYELKQFFRTRDVKIYQQAKKEIKKQLEEL